MRLRRRLGYNGGVPEVPAVPLRDHFRPPANAVPFDGVMGGWPALLIQRHFDSLPPGYSLFPVVRRAGSTAFETVPEQDEYEVRVYDETFGRRLVAVVELVSPANKDRPDSRRAFVAKCAALLQQDVCVAIVDIVPVRRFNLYAELLELIGGSDPLMADGPPTYAVTLRGRRGSHRRIETFAHVLQVGQPLPTLPLWLSADQWVPVELEPTYEETCRLLGVP